MVTVIGKIKGKERPRFINGHTYTPNATKTYEKLIRDNYIKQCNKKHNGAVRVEIMAYYKIPKSYTKKRIKNILDGMEKPTKKPDVDNIIKIVLDSLNKIAYADDKQVVKVSLEKLYTKEDERIEFNVKECGYEKKLLSKREKKIKERN